ncbi:MAG: APC family permease [Acidobacteriia bacterium]|nr:APC family permease [Terriglobia bacterium]
MPDPSAKKTALARTLRTTEYFTLAFGTMVGVGWLIVIDDWLGRGGPGGAMLGFLLGGLALVPIAFVYGKFVRAIPDAASELAYATTVFPASVGYFAGWLMTLAYLIVCPWEAVAIGKVVSYLLPALQTCEIYRVGGVPVYLPSLLLGLMTTAFVVILNYRGIRLSARFQNLITFALLALFAAFTMTGSTRDRVDNLRPFFSRSLDSGWAGVVISIVMVLQIVPYFMTGFESVPKCSEEAREGFNPRGFMRAIFLGLGTGTVFYVVIIGVVAALVPWQTLTNERYATAVAFRRAFGSDFIVRAVILAALLSLLKVFNANFLTASRLIFALGRREMIPARMGRVHPRFQSPHQAVLFCAAVTVAGALLGESILIPVTEVGSLCSALGWLVTCVAFIFWRGAEPGGVPQKRREIAIAGAGGVVAIALLLLKLLPFVPGSFRLWEYLSLGSWIALGAMLWRRPRKIQDLSVP